MNLDEFLIKRDIVLTKEVLGICNDGIKKMEKSKDPHHSDRHVYGLLDELDRFLDRENPKLDFSVLIPAICWHDSWKSTRPQSTNLPVFLFDQVYDGRGSARMFTQYAKKTKLSGELLSRIGYAIAKHSQLSHWVKLHNLFKPKTVEAQILRDMDELDHYSLGCFNHLKTTYVGDRKKLDPKFIPVAKWWLFNIVAKSKGDRFYFDYSREEFLKRKEKIIDEIIKIWNDRYSYVENIPANKKHLEDPKMENFIEQHKTSKSMDT